ncbi:unnamed protein product [Blepharisma stoltei]|uniref:Uncharacterized protein n=1 Tax=Blepharisma stoltei TaxID=1481888 RepID=A0AAU9IME6_9CILI|nr:unnamed protein product [Blepharisma stoltei]
MSLFCESQEEREQHLLIWMADIKQELIDHAIEKSTFYGFDFDNEIPRTNKDQRYQWEGFYSNSSSKLRESILSEPESTRSTIATLQNSIFEIQDIADLDFRISIDADLMKDT